MSPELQYKKAFEAYVTVLTDWAKKQSAETVTKPWPRSITEAARLEFERVAGPGMIDALLDGVVTGVETPGFPQNAEDKINAIKLANPHAENYAREALPDRVVEINNGTMAAIQEVIRSGFEAEVSVDAIARRIRGYKPHGKPYVDGVVGLHEAWAKAVDNYRQTLIRQGYTPDQIARHTATYAKRLRMRRGENIARTEVRRAQERGTSIAFETAKANGMLGLGTVRRWITAMDDRTCPICAPLDKQTAPIGKPFPGGIMEPPAHPNCRCTVALFSPTSSRQLPTPPDPLQLTRQAERNREFEAKRRSLKPTER